ncbi:MAG TPA: ABC transporter substrate-binding protein, partial [Candidatus Acidoferrales bacterium]|nr:ABC transporter substrate-binding protein [Candidatus Acidoferrales bacterium]
EGHMAKTPALWLRTALAVVLAVVCAVLPRSGTAADPYEIDAIVSLTGGGSFVGHDVSESLTGLEAVVNRTGGIRGRPLKFVMHDDQTVPQISVQIFNLIAAKHPAAIIGPTIAGTCAAVFPLVKDIVTYCLSPSARPARGSYVFSSSTASADQFLAMLKYFGGRGLTKVAILTSTDATGQDAERGMNEALEKFKNIDVVDREHFAPNDISVAAQITRVKSTPAQLLVAWSTGTPFGTILRAISDGGLSIPILTTAGNMSMVQLKQYTGIMPKELLFPGVSGLTPDLVTNRATKAAITAFDGALAKVGAPLPGFPHQVAWDPAMIIVSALRKLGPDATAAQVHDYMENLRGWIGINGAYDFVAVPQRGLGLGSVVITRWNAGNERWEAVSKGGGTVVGN